MIIDKESNFFKQSRKIVCDFLQTTVIVDDKIQYTNSYEKPVRVTQMPGRQPQTEDGDETQKNVELEPEKKINGHILLADLVISGFAEKGIICSVFGPNDDREILQSDIINLANNADTLVLDWVLKEGDNGDLALDTLTKVIAESNAFPEQLRLIVIYTGTPNISQVSERIRAYFGERLNEIDDFTFDIGATRITIYIKGHVEIQQDLKHRQVDFDQLVNYVIDDFTGMNAGLVTNTVLKALSVMRQNTNKIVNKFSSHLDPPYLTHRALLDSTEDAEDLLTGLISEEIGAILEEKSVGSVTNLESIKNWLLLHNKPNFTLRLSNELKEIPLDRIVNLLEVGVNEWDEISNSQKKKAHTLPLTDLFKFENDDNRYLDEAFSLITTNRSFYERTLPTLTFGTILQKVRDKSYWVCLQPRCDSVRIEKERFFPFLPLIKVDKDQRFNLALKEGDRYIRLLLRDNPHEIKLIPFDPDPDTKRVIPRALGEDGHFFVSAKRSAKYKWVGELRTEQVQRIANKFASNLARVGLDESEWLRRYSPK
jgi:hypothetical protein